MSVPVALDGLASALARRSNAAYLLTVGESGQVHCVAATLEWQDDELVVPAGTTSLRNAEARGTAVILSPPNGGLLSKEAGATLDAYSLIVDVDVTGTSAGDPSVSTGQRSTVRVRPTHAVFHRPAVAPDGGHGHDCVHVYDEAPSGG